MTSQQLGNLCNETFALSLITIINREIPTASKCTITYGARGVDQIMAHYLNGVALHIKPLRWL